MNAKQTPLIDLLNAVPKTARLLVEEENFSTRSIPVGKLCADAVEEIESLRKAAALVAAAEREACAQLVETLFGEQLQIVGCGIAAEIRARGKQE